MATIRRVPASLAAKGLLAVSTVLLVGIVLAACGSSSSHSSSATTAAPAAPATGGAGGHNMVTATETEFHIALSNAALSPGTWTFVVHNNGHVTHNLTVNGPGVQKKQTPFLAPGQTADLTVTLQKGTYEVYCAVDSHRDLGMNTTVTVS